MKNRRFVAKCLTLAMVLALMIPAPVAAKSSGGGKLLKSVTVYSEWNQSKNRWDDMTKHDYKYNKKNYPTEIKTTRYDLMFGIPIDATQDVQKAKYKFKGKTPKSMKLKNTAGRLIDTRKYNKKGLLTQTSYSFSYTDDEGKAYAKTENAAYSYTKKGMPLAWSGSRSTTYDGKTSSYSGSSTYTASQKKGIPSLIIESYTENGSTTPIMTYTRFNKKGLATEGGYVEVDSATGVQKFERGWRVEYKSKKGKVTSATVFEAVDWDDNGNVTKEEQVSMYKFKYTKKKASKTRYFKMINDVAGLTDYFNWY